MAKDMLPGAPIHLIDSHSNALGLGFQVLALARAARDGAGLEDLIELAKQARERTGVLFTAGDLDYLQRGGRINFGQRFFANMLNLVPIMEINQGPIELVGQTRSQSKAVMKIVALVEERLQGRKPVRIGIHHSDNEEAAFALRQIVQERFKPDELIMEELSPILGIHLGPDAIGLAYCAGL
jgi:DegV family protein with EDD domain